MHFFVSENKAIKKKCEKETLHLFFFLQSVPHIDKKYSGTCEKCRSGVSPQFKKYKTWTPPLALKYQKIHIIYMKISILYKIRYVHTPQTHRQFMYIPPKTQAKKRL